MRFVKSVVRSSMLCLTAAVLGACGGDDGKDGSPGQQGPIGPGIPVIQSLSVRGLPAAPGGTAVVSASAQSPEGLALTYSWSVSAGWTIASGRSSAEVTLTAPAGYAASGAATVTITDASGRTAIGTAALMTIDNTAPVVHSLSAFPTPARNGEAFIVDANAADANNDALSYAWTLPSGFTLVDGAGSARVTARPDGFVSGNVSVTVTDAGGAATSASFYASTRDGAWIANGLLHSPLSIAGSEDLALDDAGNAVAVWIADASGVASVWSSRYVAQTGWTAPELLESSANVASRAVVAMSANGDAIALWQQADSPANLWARRYVHGAGWQTALLVDQSSSAVASADAVMDPQGAATIVWSEVNGVRLDAFARRFVPASGWGAPTSIENSNATVSDFRVVTDRTGNVLVVWYANDFYAISTNRFVAGNGWQGAVTLESGAQYHDIDLAMNDTGDAALLWTEEIGGSSLWMRRFTSSQWQPKVQIGSTSNATTATTGGVAIDGVGNIIALWRDGPWLDSTADVWARRFVAGSGPGSGWGTATQLETHTGGSVSIRLVGDRFGNATAAWLQSNLAGTQLITRRFATSEAAWRPAMAIETQDDPRTLALGIDRSGRMMLISKQMSVASSTFRLAAYAFQ